MYSGLRLLLGNNHGRSGSVDGLAAFVSWVWEAERCAVENGCGVETALVADCSVEGGKGGRAAKSRVGVL